MDPSACQCTHVANVPCTHSMCCLFIDEIRLLTCTGTYQAATMAESAALAPEGGPASRMIITKLRMENFKSYYGVQDVGPFHKVRIEQRFHCKPTLINHHLCMCVSLSLSLTLPLFQRCIFVFLCCTVLLVGGWSQRLWKVQRDRCHALRVWIPRKENPPSQAQRPHSQLRAPPKSPIVPCHRVHAGDHRQGNPRLSWSSTVL